MQEDPQAGKGPRDPYSKVTHTEASKPGRDTPAPSRDNGEGGKAQGRRPAQLLSQRSQNQDHRASQAGYCLPSKLGFPAGVDTVTGEAGLPEAPELLGLFLSPESSYTRWPASLQIQPWLEPLSTPILTSDAEYLQQSGPSPRILLPFTGSWSPFYR